MDREVITVHVRAYIRVSTEEQAEEGFSLPTQRQRITDFCRSQWGDAPEITWYEDDGFSAKDMDRPRLGALRRDVQPGDLVVVLRLDRLTRSVLDLYTLLQEWEKRSIFFRSVTEPYDTQKPEGRFMIGLLALLAEWERLRIGERVREVMANTVRTDRRHLSKPPLGYSLVNGELIVEEAEAEIVGQIFALCLSGLGTRAIALRLNEQGLRTKQRARWTDFAVSYVLRNPVYAGQIAWQRKESGAIVVDGAHQPLIAPERFAGAQAMLERRRKARGGGAAGQHPLTGLAYCGLCGGPIHGVVQRRYAGGKRVAGRERRYYRCSRREHLKSCSLPYLPAEALEERVLAQIPPGRLTNAAPAPDPAAAQQAERRRLERALRRWDEAYAAGDLSLAEWRERTTPLKARQQELSAAPPQAGEQGRRPWGALAPPEQRALLHGLLERIDCLPGGGVLVTPRKEWNS